MTENLFWGKVDFGPDCWLWTASKDRLGYGKVSYQGFHGWVHRLAWELFFGFRPTGLCVLHHCDNPSCVRPSHLFLGTRADNILDMYGKGREGDFTGEKGNNVKFTWEQIREIRRRYTGKWGEQSRLAREYGTSQSNIWDILTHKNWKESNS